MSEGPIPAPELDGATEWLNVAEPIRMTQLRGKVVLLDFWTYGCINCLHVLQDLKVLEERFPDELVVIGVHSPKFPNEKIAENLKRILVRYEVEHPVANDAHHQIWRRYGVQAWPTRVIIDPAGNLVGTAMGEGNLPGFVDAIRGVIRVFDDPSTSLGAGRVRINRSRLPLQLERERHADQPLLYPGKVLADESSGRLFIADSNHNRIVVADLGSAVSGSSRMIEVIGSGLQGDADGIFTQARFRRPQGLACDGTSLYVADQGNNQLRVVDFDVRAVHTLDVGRLSSPWDLAVKTGILIVAMAGPHQIWVVDLLHDRAYPYAGTGEEARRDGMVNAAAFAQPSGLAVADHTLYVADAESNSIRAVALPPVNDVRTIAGGDLFDFGDRDGKGDAARFQHPLGVAVHDGRVFIADTYNHKIKVMDPATGAVTTFAGGNGEFHEPGGISIAAGRIFVADTNNHRIRTIDPTTRQVATLTIEGLAPPAAWSYLRRA
ncbi:MAG TPA: thioredoxin-like domain-containing protein [Vicinamibacterales bacterium]|nr:thioredoxin-like domain-containing protein [Vicinamibacterales bacterium]